MTHELGSGLARLTRGCRNVSYVVLTSKTNLRAVVRKIAIIEAGQAARHSRSQILRSFGHVVSERRVYTSQHLKKPA